MLDSLVLKYALYENGLPPNHTAGGINMNFFPMGGLMRRTGIFFIRRSFKDNEVYKFVLRQYIDYLIEKRFPLVFLPTHKSMLDSLVLKYALYENGLPPNHTAGGINMNFFPMGGLMRRTGIFFIRRSFKDNEVYKFVLRQYIDYLIEKRFPLE